MAHSEVLALGLCQGRIFGAFTPYNFQLGATQPTPFSGSSSYIHSVCGVSFSVQSQAKANVGQRPKAYDCPS